MIDNGDNPSTYSRPVDLVEAAKNAPTKRELAWTLLKQTRNPEYVAARYGFTLKQMRDALRKYDDEQTDKRDRTSSRHGNTKS